MPDLLSKDMPDEKKQALIMQSHLQPVWQSQGNCRRSVISGVSMARYTTGHALNVKGGSVLAERHRLRRPILSLSTAYEK